MKNRYRLVLASLALAASAVVASAENKCQMYLLADAKILVDQDGTVLVPVSFEGRDVWMVLAMHQGLPSLFHGAVEELGLKSRLKRSDWEAKIGDRKIERQVKAKSLRLESANFTGWDLLVYPDFGQPLAIVEGKPVIGTLTSVFMNVVDVELNLGASQFRLFRHKACDGFPAHWRGEATDAPLYIDGSGLLMFALELDGQNVEASLNTSGRRSVLTTRVSREFFGFDEDSPEIHKEVVGAGSEVISFHAMSLTSKGLNIRNTPIALRSGDPCAVERAARAPTGSHISAKRDSRSIGYSECLSKTPLAIGTDLLKKLRIYVGSKEKAIYFQSAESP